MKRMHRIAVVCGSAVIFAGCSTLNDQKWIQDTKEVSVKAAATVEDTTTKTFKRMQHYLAEKDVLQTFHDAGEHSEAAVLDVLHSSKAHVSAGSSAHKATAHARTRQQKPSRQRRPQCRCRRSTPATCAGPSMPAS
jgi:hypothetical protein